jgi:hypothetical protein
MDGTGNLTAPPSTAPPTPIAPPTVTSTPPPTLQPTASPIPIAPPPPLVSFSGSTSKKTATFSVAGTLQIAYSVSSQSNFTVDLDAPDGSATSIANLIGSGKVTTWVYGMSGPVFLDVIAGGPWKITVTEVEPASGVPPQKFSGATDVTTVPVTFVGGEALTWTFKGDGHFIVDIIDPSDGSPVDNVVDTIGGGSDSTQVSDAGEYALDVTANGAWSVAIAP